MEGWGWSWDCLPSGHFTRAADCTRNERDIEVECACAEKSVYVCVESGDAGLEERDSLERKGEEKEKVAN